MTMTPEDIERLNERRKHRAFEKFVVPFVYAPVLSLVRFGPFKGQTRDVLFGFGIACGLAHAGYVMSRESSVIYIYMCVSFRFSKSSSSRIGKHTGHHPKEIFCKSMNFISLFDIRTSLKVIERICSLLEM